MIPLILVGGGGHCASVIDVALSTKKFRIIGILDKEEKVGSSLMGIPIIGTDKMIEDCVKKDYFFIVTVGQIKSPKARIEIVKKIEQANAKFATIISPNSIIANEVEIGEGTVIHHGGVINSLTKIGRHCIVNSMALIEHGVFVGDFCHLSTRITINGDCVLGKNVFIGSGSAISNQIDIGDDVIVGMGSVVLKEIGNNKKVIGLWN